MLLALLLVVHGSTHEYMVGFISQKYLSIGTATAATVSLTIKHTANNTGMNRFMNMRSPLRAEP